MELTHHDITEFRELIARKQEEQTDRIVDAIEQNTEKLQEVLERIECIDNSFDTLLEAHENASVHTHTRLDKLIQQGG